MTREKERDNLTGGEEECKTQFAPWLYIFLCPCEQKCVVLGKKDNWDRILGQL